MRRVLRSVAVSALALALTSLAPTAVAALSRGPAGGHDCQDTTHSCTLPALIGCRCAQQAPVSLPAAPDRGSELKPQHCGAGLAIVATFTISPLIAAVYYSPSTHRAGPPPSLPVLHASLLI